MTKAMRPREPWMPERPPTPRSVATRYPRPRLAASMLLAAVLGWTAATGTSAQVAPSAAELRAYDGWLRAAVEGDVPRLQALIAAGADLDARDTRGRTALHIATHARRHDAIRVLARAGASLDALEADRYDAVTIAAVADDVPTLALLLSLLDRQGCTPLQLAREYGHEAMVAMLEAAGKR